MSSSEPMTPTASPEPESVLIRPWPKIVFLYPTFLASTLFCLISWLAPANADGAKELVSGNVFMIVFALNLMVFAFDFSRIKSLTLLILLVAIVLLVLWLNTKWQVVGFLGNVVDHIDIRMNTAFYAAFSGVLAFILVLVFVNSRFNYYEVNAREILHHHGYLGDVTRWSTEGLEMKKSITDLVELALLRSGRLIFLPQGTKEAIVLDNVANVTRIEGRVKDLLSVVAVRFNQRPGPG